MSEELRVRVHVVDSLFHHGEHYTTMKDKKMIVCEGPNCPVCRIIDAPKLAHPIKLVPIDRRDLSKGFKSTA